MTHVDVIGLISTSQDGIDAFMQQPNLPPDLPIHAFLLPRQQVPIRDAENDTVEWKTSWFRGRDPHSTAVGEAHKHVLRSMIDLYPQARSVTIMEDDARMREGGLATVEACTAWMDENDDDWDLFYFGHYPLAPTAQVAESVVKTPMPLAAHAVAYHKRIIPQVLEWNFYTLAIDERLGMRTPQWRKYAAYPDVFYQEREPILSSIVRPLWPNIIGLPFVRTYNARVFADDLNHLMLKQQSIWPIVVAWATSAAIVALWCFLFIKATWQAIAFKNDRLTHRNLISV